MASLHNTEGIVLHQMKYGESSVIAKIYTEKFGLQSYIVKGVRSKKSRTKYNLFQPGNILDMVVYYREKSSLRNIKEVRMGHHYESISFDVVKGSVLLFMTEVLYKSIYEEETNADMYGFIRESLLSLDTSKEAFSDHHLLFMVGLTAYLGFFPRCEAWKEDRYFDLQEGQFVVVKPMHDHWLSPELATSFYRLVNKLKNPSLDLNMDNLKRKVLLEKLIEYYRLHMPLFREIHSHQVLGEVLSG